MRGRELTRLRVLIDLSDDCLTVEAAGRLLGLGRRQVYRLRRAFAVEGPTALVSRKRGRARNHQHGETFRRTVLSLVHEHYRDFGPTLAVEKLAARHGLRLSVETLRQWMIGDGLWVDRRHRLASPHQPRRRRECLGLVQIDGSEHACSEDRGPTCTLLAFVDDATSRLKVSDAQRQEIDRIEDPIIRELVQRIIRGEANDEAIAAKAQAAALAAVTIVASGLAADIGALKAEVANLKEEVRILRARTDRLRLPPPPPKQSRASHAGQVALLRLDKLSYDIHMVAEGMLQRGMIDVEASGSVEIGSAAHRSGQAIAAWRATGGSGTST